jgi:hypothetical protein
LILKFHSDRAYHAGLDGMDHITRLDYPNSQYLRDISIQYDGFEVVHYFRRVYKIYLALSQEILTKECSPYFQASQTTNKKQKMNTSKLQEKLTLLSIDITY